MSINCGFEVKHVNFSSRAHNLDFVVFIPVGNQDIHQPRIKIVLVVTPEIFFRLVIKKLKLNKIS